jgi:amino acid transporter
VAANSSQPAIMLSAWGLGGVISLIGALCYAELATTYPHAGGNYIYLKQALGKEIAFLFAWARMTVVQTGSIALLAFVFGDYASQLLNLGALSPSLYATGAVVLFTGLNLLGVSQSKRAQNALTVLTVMGLLVVIVIGLAAAVVPDAVVPKPAATNNLSAAMIFVLLSYGGWNEAAYLSSEIKNPHRNITRALLWSVGIITALYVLLNVAYLRGLGLSAMAESNAIAADLMRQVFGQGGAIAISIIVAITSLSSMSASIFTGARTNFAFAQDVALHQFLGRRHTSASMQTSGFLVQAAISLALILLGTLTRNGFKTMVDYTAPVFWFFFLLSGISLFILRIRDPNRPRPFRVPLYPVIPLLFCAICGYLLYSSLVFTGVGAMVGVVVMGLGLPLLYWLRTKQQF